MKLGVVFGAVLVAVAAEARSLTFSERVAAQRSIERVYYRHQIGATLPFERAFPQEVLEEKVRTYLRQSAALEQQWRTPVTAEALRAELERIAHGTRMPERLIELYDALGGDPFLIAECLARPILVDRLTRSFFAGDERLHGAERRSWDDWWNGAATDFDGGSVEAVAFAGDRLPLPATAGTRGCVADDTWDNGVLDDIPDGFRDSSVVWTGSEMIVWGGGGGVDKGARYDPMTDSWRATSTLNAPEPRERHTAVWTGSHMIVWGGLGGSSPSLNTGAAYDPVSDSWTPTTTTGAPAGRRNHTAIWTGDRMVIWGGGHLNSGGRYDPGTDSWTPTTTIGAPVGRSNHTAVWTGDSMIVWGGHDFNTNFDSGGRYDPIADSWIPTSGTLAPWPRADHSAQWIGDVMVVWGGTIASGSVGTRTGGRYDPRTDSWAPTTLTGAPEARTQHTGVSTGTHLAVWGGWNSGSLDSGGLYDPQADAWTAVSQLNAPSPRSGHQAVWDGTRMIVWGGGRPSGGRYDPTTQSWTPTSAGTAPTSRFDHTAVWTGNRMIVWGGDRSLDGGSLDSGGRYDPVIDSWSATSTLGAPAPRRGHTAVWTGDRMLIWGGSDTSQGGSTLLDSGGSYNPWTDSWTPTSAIGAPSPRHWHTAIWTGTRMVVWGGLTASGATDSGGRYDPAVDAWTPTSLFAAPLARSFHTAIWTGTRMLVWGGHSTNLLSLNTGGRYDPATNSWTATSTTGAPFPRGEHTAVWTGSRMIVWGGIYWEFDFYDSLDSGSRYDPALDSWAPVSSVNAPSARSEHTAVWTGSRMIVWGGLASEDDHGLRYDLATDSWSDVSAVDQPVRRQQHSAVWANGSMLVWGGKTDYTTDLVSGGRYALEQTIDNDGDGLSECDGDCHDGDATVLTVPAAVENLRWIAADALLWDADPSPGAATRWQVMYGDLAEVSSFVTAPGDTCMAEDLTRPRVDDESPLPAAGQAWYFLVRGANVCGWGGWGIASDGSGRTTTVCD
jgi:N-acetylneuraminic acid mutarotase